MDAFNELLESFSSSKREKLQELFDNYKLTKAQMLILLKASADLELFLEDDIFKFLVKCAALILIKFIDLKLVRMFSE